MAVREIANDLFFSNVKNIIDSGKQVELKIKGTSMHPTLLDGKHKVVLTPYEKKYLQIGVMALFVYKQKYILHRLVAINGDQLIFQGDNLPYVKEFVEEKDIIAIVEFIITPTDKVIDCRKYSFFIKNRLWRSIYQSYTIFLIKARGFFIKIFS